MDNRRARHLRTRLLPAVVALVALIALAAVASSDPLERLGRNAWVSALLFAALVLSEVVGALAERAERVRPLEAESWAFAFALLIYAPSAALLLLAALVRVAIALVRRRPGAAALMSGASTLVTMAAGLGVLAAFGAGAGLAGGSPSGGSVAGQVAAALAMALVAGLLRALWWSYARGVSVRFALGPEAAEVFGAEVVLLLLGVLVLALVERSGVFAPVAVAVALAVQYGAKRALEGSRLRSVDALTNLANRTTFEKGVEAFVAEAERRGGGFAVYLIDLDGFGEINATLGTTVGDLALKAMAGRLEGGLRPTDLLGRVGGDEFAIAAYRVESRDEVEALAARLRQQIARPLEVGGCPVALTGSIGVALFPDHGTNAAELIAHSDVALFGAKRRRQGVSTYQGEAERFNTGRFSLLADLRQAIGTSQLYLVYQPKVDLASDRVAGVEALLRWNHPRLGLVGPAEFMPLAEQTELMGPLTAWVVREALAQCARWHSGGIKVGVAVNTSAKNLHDLEFPGMVARELGLAGVEPGWLEMEITESTVMADPTRSRLVIEQLRGMGVAVSVDDFGAGYSSFTYLQQLPISSVKIDSSFVTTMAGDANGRAIVRAIIDLAKDLSIGTVAEGVETEEVMEALRTLGCSMAQGYYIHRPAAAADMTHWLAGGTIPAARSRRAGGGNSAE
ncbi:MAG: bifunctional diguanylate cyclase/phosphodiesterase [Nitrospiraceae bacterium]|nr:bifunctional diguanylate cyclase/phosphodiesterase [Nitrospiraceae bacterium]